MSVVTIAFQASHAQFVQLTRVHAREIVRNSRAVATLLLGFVFLVAIFVILDAVITRALDQSPHLVVNSLGVIALIGFTAVAFTLTAVPLVTYRRTGVLRLVATTPARRSVFLIAHLPIRLAIIVAEIAVLLAVSTVYEHMPVTTIFAIAVTLVLGALMLLSVGYLVSARMANPDLALHLAYLIPLGALATSGAIVPLEIFPPPVNAIFQLVPTTWFVAALDAQVAGVSPQWPLPVLWILLGLVAMVAAWAAAKMFRWTDRR